MKKIIFMFLAVFSASTCYGRDIVPRLVEHLKRTSVLILAGESKTLAGTGFLTMNEKQQVLVLTNKHVAQKGSPLFVRVNAEEKCMDYPAGVLALSDNLDLAVLALKKQKPLRIWKGTDLIIPPSMFGDKEGIVEGGAIIYIGYPLGLGAEEKNYPLTRRGMVAQYIPGRETFLVDGFANHGNSGSPVFDANNGKLLGIVTSFEPDYIDSYEAKKLISRIPFNSGISRVISVEAIKNIISRASVKSKPAK